MKNRSMAAVLLALTALTGCGDDDDIVDPSEVTGGEWRLESFQRADFSVVRTDPDLYTLTLGQEGALFARSDCNTCIGRYTLSGETFTVSPLACSRVFCGAASLDPEYPQALETAQSLDEDDDRLTVRAGAITLRYIR